MILLSFQYEFSASYLELYNEKIRDLAKGNKDNETHDIKGISNCKVHVTRLTERKVHTKEEVHHIELQCFNRK